MPANAPYCLILFGQVDLRGPATRAGDLLVQSKVVALLAYLGIPTVGRFVRRDRLVGLLWPELDQSRARKALRQALHEIRECTGPEVLLSRGDEEIALSDVEVSCDVAAFIHAADAGLLMQALQLYRGEIMPGFHLPDCAEYDQWL